MDGMLTTRLPSTFMRKLPTVVAAVLAIALSGCTSHPNPAGVSTSPVPTTTGAQPAHRECETNFLAQLSTRQKLAQLITAGVSSTADAEALVRTEQIGGLFIGSWTDQSMLAQNQLDQVKSLSRVPLMVTIDEEGGRVSRVKNLIGPIPAAREVAQTMSADEYYQRSLARAKALRQLGITVDLAPDIDVSDQPADSVIGDRSYSNDPAVVTEYGKALIRALHDAGLGAVLKHFPGHGHGSGDSHTNTVQTPPLDQLKQLDLVPFRNLIDSQDNGTAPAVMVGHLDVPGLTTAGVPASISPAAMALLRLGTGYGAAPFEGPIFTDDLSDMAAITNRLSIPDAVSAALKAGADTALIAGSKKVPSTQAVSPILDQLEQEVRSGRLPAAQVDASVLRMARYKGVPLQC